ncbi:EAL domain-containing protein [Catenovulum adriaticum]|uniref:EAL domain-containing protein n=1 Tax=Catenovulum adriaticum TaxID=2984846 RepID=A0ABY7AL60_9ALTE|nr:EAL domain-containing protein [Catenovulum sp. TS8]WAJ70050.1 EAL domain-containing protein [Catenovulum sp. TS8]
MTTLPLKTTARSLFAWQQRFALLISLFTLCCISIWCFSVADNAKHHFKQKLQLILTMQPDIKLNQLSPLLAKQFDVSAIYYPASQRLEKLNPTSFFDWTTKSSPIAITTEGVNSKQNIQIEYIVLADHYVLFIATVTGFFWLIALFVLWSISRISERKVFMIERKARRMQIASRHEMGKRPNLFNLLDSLLDELNFARQEQSRVDKFIRIQTFLDPQTGIGNQVYFNNRLEALLNIEEKIAQGAVIGLRLNGLAEIEERHGDDTALEVLVQFTNIIEQALQRYKQAIFARHSQYDLGIIIANISVKEIELLCNHLMRSLAHVRVPKKTDIDNLFHIGVATFKSGDLLPQVLREADMAIRSAELQGPSSWFMFEEEDSVKTMTMGSLQWRTLLENKLANNGFLICFQAVMKTQPYQVHHQEVIVQVQDRQGQMLPSNLFMPMAHKCGLATQIDKQIMGLLAQQLTASQNSVLTSIHLSPDSLLDKSFRNWLTNLLAENTQFAEQVIIEISEHAIVNYIEELSYFVQQLDNLSVQILIDQVGQYVTSSNYIKQLPIRYLKLHPSIVRNIHQRSENQLFIRSLQGTCAGTKIKIFAYGIENLEDWQEIKNLGLAGAQGSYTTLKTNP